MSEIAKAYEPGSVESQWYEHWLENRAFEGNPVEGKKSYCIMIPPPNVTGVLTMGHVLNNTIQDILIRRARLEGKCAMWLPGTDHAGIATQTRVERELRKEGKTRHDLGRKSFVDQVWKWREKHGGIILEQLRRLGASCDWSRTNFTLDPHYSKAVLHAFVLLYERGFIYRGKRMVNWCPASLTALSDEEVIMKPQNGLLYTMRYERVDEPGKYLQIATTRPETIMGDTGVAVNPDDERYANLIGRSVWRPFPREEIPIVADRAVDVEFGTGVLKVTPAHDKLDFEIGQRHGLAVRDVFNPDGTLNELAGEEFNGIDRFEARRMATLKLKEMGLLISETPYVNNIGYSEREDVPIEPRLSEQWFLKYPKVEEAKEVVKSGLIKFWPQRWEKTYLHWLDNIQDWCISRQLWWGHRIPVWYRKNADRRDPAHWHVSVGGPEDPENWEQDEDVLDTWASSWLWPFATMGWPEPDIEAKKDLAFFYPTTDLVTGPDIIFFWVARMIMAGLEFMGEAKKTLTREEMKARIPFQNVYFTGIIRDEKGRKMSKSLGNSPEPLDLIARFGADGVRFGIMNIAPKGQDILFSEDRIEIGRNFCNKLWNACRFRQMSGPMLENTSLSSIIERLDPAACDAYDHWILSRLIDAVETIERYFKQYEFNQMTQCLYTFFWNDFCDWYVEVSKGKMRNDDLRDNCLALQDLVLRQVLLLLYPVTPHIAEELWHLLGYCTDSDLLQDTLIERSDELLQSLNQSGLWIDRKAVQHVENLAEFITKARSLKADYNVANKRDVSLVYVADEVSRQLLQSHCDTIMRLAGAGSLEARDSVTDAPGSVTAIGTVYLDLKASVNVAAEKERLGKELDRIENAIRSGKAKLENANFTSKAPEAVIQGARDRLDEACSRQKEVARLLEQLEV